MLKAVANVSIYVDDLEKAVQFYEGTLGVEVIWEYGNFVGLKNGIILQNIDPSEDRHRPLYEVEDTLKAIEILKERGVEVVRGPLDNPSGKSAALRDPFGNVLFIMDKSNWK